MPRATLSLSAPLPARLLDIAAPCGGCNYQPKCRRGKIACEDFYRYAKGEKMTGELKHRVPSRDWYSMLWNPA